MESPINRLQIVASTLLHIFWWCSECVLTPFNGLIIFIIILWSLLKHFCIPFFLLKPVSALLFLFYCGPTVCTLLFFNCTYFSLRLYLFNVVKVRDHKGVQIVGCKLKSWKIEIFEKKIYIKQYFSEKWKCLLQSTDCEKI